MKKIILFCFVFLLLSTTNKEEIIGYWELYKIEKLSIHKTKEKRSKFIKFYENGKLEGGRIGEDVRNTGTWKIKQNVLIISGGVSDSGDYNIELLTKDQLILFKDSVRIHLDRGIQ